MRMMRDITTPDFVNMCNKVDIVLVNFDTLRSLISIFRQFKFLRIVVDEAHVARNQLTKGFKSLYELWAHYYICLTGSPISNNMSDLHSLFRLMKTRVLMDPYIWKTHIELPSIGNNEDAEETVS